LLYQNNPEIINLEEEKGFLARILEVLIHPWPVGPITFGLVVRQQTMAGACSKLITSWL
jgi:hypothetical protein